MDENKKTRIYKYCTCILLTIILGYHVFTFMDTHWNAEFWHVTATLFHGIYGFLDSMWLFGSIVLLIVLKNELKITDEPQKSSKVLYIVSLLVMILGIYSMDTIKQHIDGFTNGLEWLWGKLSGTAPVIIISLTVLGLLVVGIIYIVKLIKSRDNYLKTKQTTRENINRNYYYEDGLQHEKYFEDQEATGEQEDFASQEKVTVQEHGNIFGTKHMKPNMLVFFLVIPIALHIVILILNGELLQNLGLSSAYLQTIRDGNTLTELQTWTFPFAIASIVIFFSIFIAWMFSLFYQYINRLKNNMGHPQALLAIIIEILLLVLSPFLKEVDIFKSLIEAAIDGNIVNTVILLVVFFLVIWIFLVMLSVPEYGPEKDETIENKIRSKCEELISSIQGIAIGLIESGIQVIRLATVDYLGVIFDLFDVKKPESNDKKPKNGGKK